MTFYKMQANGNDFVVFSVPCPIRHCQDTIKRICHHRLGVGCDQLLIICPSEDKDNLFLCRIFNTDGTEAFQCGNGACCVALHAFETLYPNEQELVFKMGRSSVVACRLSSSLIKIKMGVPLFSPKQQAHSIYEFPCAVERHWPLLRVSLGNDHAIVFNQNVSLGLVSCIAWQLMTVIDPVRGINVSFCDVLSSSDIKLTTVERGVGLTAGCGSASCSAVAAGIRAGFLSDTVSVALLESKVTVCWPKQEGDIYLIGEAYHSFRGVLPSEWTDALLVNPKA